MKKKSIFLKQMAIMVLLIAVIITTGLGTGTAILIYSNKEGNGNKKQDGYHINVENKIEKDKKKLVFYSTQEESEANRDENLRIACEKINGTVIKSGNDFSFNELIGSCTYEEGYKEAGIIVGGTQVTDGVGGGVCQVATTLYNVALQSGFKIKERHRHSFPVNYVPVGLDAAINWPDKDLIIKNSLDMDITIEAKADKGNVTIAFYGTEDLPEIKIESEVLKEEKPPKKEIQFSDELEPGEQQVLQESHKGYHVKTYRQYIKDDEVSKQELISEDKYPAVQKIVLEGSSNTKK